MMAKVQRRCNSGMQDVVILYTKQNMGICETRQDSAELRFRRSNRASIGRVPWVTDLTEPAGWACRTELRFRSAEARRRWCVPRLARGAQSPAGDADVIQRLLTWYLTGNNLHTERRSNAASLSRQADYKSVGWAVGGIDAHRSRRYFGVVCREARLRPHIPLCHNDGTRTRDAIRRR